MKKRLSILPALALTVLLCCAVAFASDGRAAVTLSYLAGTFKEQLTAALTGKLDKLDDACQTAIGELVEQTGYDPAMVWSSADIPRTIYPRVGETVTLGAGSGLFWYAGTGTSAGVLIDATTGKELEEGSPLTAGHHYITEDGASVAVSSVSHCAAEGRWTTGPAVPEPPAVLSVGNDPAETGTAVSTTQTVLLDGVPLEFQTYALLDENGWQTNYIKLRDLAFHLKDSDKRFAVDYVVSLGSVIVFMDRGQAYTVDNTELSTPFQGDRAYQIASGTMVVNGAPTQLHAFRLTDDNGGGYTYYKLRDLGQVLDIYMTLSEGVPLLDTTRPYEYDS